MAQIVPDPSLLSSLASRVVVLTGGASGIGAALTTLLHANGSHVFFGDISHGAGQELESNLSSASANSSKTRGTAKFVACDVSRYADIYKLFRTAYDMHGRVDHAVSCAGVLDRGKFFDDANSTIESIEDDAGDASVLEINLTGSINFARIASVFVRQPSASTKSEGLQSRDKTITFLSSIAGLRDSPGMPLYQTSKVALLGLVRGMRNLDLSFPLDENNRGKVRVNAICPGMTQSAMTEHLIPKFQAAERSVEEQGGRGYWQTSRQAAEVIALLMADGRTHGKSVYVEAGTGWEFEDGLKDNMDVWLGHEPTMMLRSNVDFIRSLGGIRKD